MLQIYLLGCIILSNAGSLAGAFMPDYWSYFTLRMVTAIGAGGLYMSAFTLTVELVGSKQVCWKIHFLTSNNFSSKYNQIDTIILMLFVDGAMDAMVDIQMSAWDHHISSLCTGRDDCGSVCHLHQRLCDPAVGHVPGVLHTAPPLVPHTRVTKMAAQQGQGGGGQVNHGDWCKMEWEGGRFVWTHSFRRGCENLGGAWLY